MTDFSMKDTFDALAAARPLQNTTPQKSKRLPPLSFRATLEERALLKAWAGALPVSAYIRKRLFGDKASPRKCNRRLPSVDHEALSKALALLGQSRLSSNMNQIAKATNLGTLPVSDDLQEELLAACADIQQMRAALIEALDLKARE